MGAPLATPTGLYGSGLYGSGLVTDAAGEPLRPGGLALTGALLDRAGFAPGDRVVDVGCGQGASVALMGGRGLRAVGVDAADGPLAAARARGVPVLRARGDALPLADGSVDGVLSECSLSVMADRGRALAEWARVLRAGGRLALGDVYGRRPDGAAAAEGCAALAGRRALERAVAAAGLRVAGFEDRSEVLAGWVARFVFRYGSLDALWGGACGLTAEAARRAAPGYCLLVARKPGDAAARGKGDHR
ncbi:DVU_1556 family methyltransferase [Azospirillum sp. ST 5-10]|uniref:DVU_1556 family methyltransferase n=1 Tax=unclassified Azospirillum TaxID=2630922 RepID=UPI003F4A5E2A